MRRPVVLALAVAALAGSAAGPAHALPRSRTIESGYTVSGVGGVLRGSYGAQGMSGGAVFVPLKPYERYARIWLTDDSGFPVGGDVALDLNHDNLADVFLESFCGSTETARKIPPFEDAVLVVYPVADTCGAATKGVARITLTDR
ncbi:MAG TPA: hypothetical protein VF519_05765 [Mycobacteriales bacterium]|jgi:hypothetical protein